MSFCSSIVVLLAIFIGLLLSPIPTRLGFYRWLASRNPKFLGFSPAMNYGIEWGYSFDELYSQDISGQKAIVTGANSGLGFEVSLALAKLGASVTMACRNEDKCRHAAHSIYQHKGVKGKVTPMKMELSSLKSVKTFAESYLEKNDGAIDMLFLNAGILRQTPLDADTFLLSEDGIELVFATNVVGHHLLYKLLEPKLMQSKMARVVLTSSNASFDTFDYGVATDLQTLNNEKVTVMNGGKLYGQSKLAQIMWAKKLTRSRGSDDSFMFVNSVHPGFAATPAFSKGPIPWFLQKIFDELRPAMWTAKDAALNLLYLGVATDELKKKNVRGKFFMPMVVEAENPLSLNVELQDKVWAFLDDLVKDYAS